MFLDLFKVLAVLAWTRHKLDDFVFHSPTYNGDTTELVLATTCYHWLPAARCQYIIFNSLFDFDSGWRSK